MLHSARGDKILSDEKFYYTLIKTYAIKIPELFGNSVSFLNEIVCSVLNKKTENLEIRGFLHLP